MSRGLRELDASRPPLCQRTRSGFQHGAEPATAREPTLLRDDDALVDPSAHGDLQLAASLDLPEHAHVGGDHGGARPLPSPAPWSPSLLHGLGWSLRGNVETREGPEHPDRSAQFRYVARQVRASHRRGQSGDLPVDAKKKEMVGAAARNGGTGPGAQRSTPCSALFTSTTLVTPDAARALALFYSVYNLRRDEELIKHSHRPRRGDLRRAIESSALHGGTSAGPCFVPFYAAHAPRTPVAATAPASALEVGVTAAGATRPGWPSRSVIFRRVRASRTR